MRIALGAALAATLLAVPPAHAGNDSVYQGGCNLTAQPLGGQSQWAGFLTGLVVVYSVQTPQDNPVSAWLGCEIRVNGVTVVGPYTGAGTTVVSQSNLVQYVAGPTDVVEVCTTIDYTSNATATVAFC